jgi:tRNA(Arg) A34 adenosine deaminase TadA
VLDAAGGVVAEAENRRVRDCDPTAHAEVLALRAAGRHLGNWSAACAQPEGPCQRLAKESAVCVCVCVGRGVG